MKKPWEESAKEGQVNLVNGSEKSTMLKTEPSVSAIRTWLLIAKEGGKLEWLGSPDSKGVDSKMLCRE